MKHTASARGSLFLELRAEQVRKDKMMENRTYFLITGCIFGVVASMHLLRIIDHWTVIIGPWTVPLWFSWLGLVLAGCLCIWALQLIGNKKQEGGGDIDDSANRTNNQNPFDRS